jgi:hypothetical protein
MTTLDVPDRITCVECGGDANRMSHPPPDEGFSSGDVVTYVCEDCGRRLDVVVEGDDAA